MTGLPPCPFPIPGPLVETGPVERECDVDNPVGEGFTDGEGEGDGETVGDGEGDGTDGSTEAAGATLFAVGVAADVLC